MKFYWDAFIDELIEGKIKNFRPVEGKEEKEEFTVRLENISPRDLCMLFYSWLEKADLVK